MVWGGETKPLSSWLKFQSGDSSAESKELLAKGSDASATSNADKAVEAKQEGHRGEEGGFGV